MGCRIFVGHEAGVGGFSPKAVLFCSTTGWAFGPIFAGHDEAEAFIDWLGREGWVPLLGGSRQTVLDPREFDDDRELEAAVSKFRETYDAN